MNRRDFAVKVVGGALAVAGVGSIAGIPALGAQKKRVLVLSQAAGFRHSSIPVAAATVRRLGEQTGKWEVLQEAGTPEEVAAAVTAENLKRFDLVFFGNTTGNLNFTPEGRTAFYQWIENGGAYAGVHSASDTFHGDPLYENLVRGHFRDHGPQVTVRIYNQDPSHPATRDVPENFEIHDEIYLFKGWDRSRVHVLLAMPKHPNNDEQGDFPVAWTNRVGKGRMFYTSLGHREDVYENEIYLKHLTGGILWALGLAEARDTPGNPPKF
jgi:uncharacterized protein